ncbi:MFS transporter [Actinomyces culturomici]|uniref:MFS transporter n=1 Tax=Actinomyces culturomici TaxID=1926276 RepID=UPI000E1FE3CB|nr:MFS transporter [Actinomyces culturomici]
MTPPTEPAVPERSRTPILVWACAMCVYVLAVAARTSLGVTGVEAMDRFGIDARGLALFSSLQVGVYGLAQIPVGSALDRFGPKRLLAVGAVLVALAQTAMAFVPSFSGAMAARVLLGIGDATAFVSVLRLVIAWFPPRSVPLFSQLTSILGMIGQIISSWPFLRLLHGVGWSQAFLAMSGLGLAAALVVLARVDMPGGFAPARAVPDTPSAPLSAALATPWTWLGFFTHLSGGVAAMTFTLLWGVPFMTLGLGASPHEAANVLVLFTGANMAFGPLAGRLTTRRPRLRIPFALGILVLVLVSWAMVLLRDAPTPLWMVALLAIILAGSQVSSTVAFDFVRQGVGPERLGTATAAANTGGFIGTLVSVELIGFALDRLADDGSYGWNDFRLALWLQAPLLLVGGIGIVVCALAARRTPEWRRPAYLRV